MAKKIIKKLNKYLKKKRTMKTKTEKTVLTESNFNHLRSLFKTEEEYRKIMKGLWKTRRGLDTIIDKQPHLKEMLMPQLIAINEIVGCLYCDGLPHPIYDPSSQPEITINVNPNELL